MMNITVENGSAEKREITKKIAEFFSGELGISHLEEEVFIAFIPGLDKECAGFTIKDLNAISVGIAAKLNLFDMIVTVAHEMVHVGQMARGELRVAYESGTPITYWKGRPTKVAYQNQPWEIEASALEVILSKKLVMKLGLAV